MSGTGPVDRARIKAKTPNATNVNRLKALIRSQGSPAKLRTSNLPGQIRALIASKGRKRIVVNDRRRNVSEIQD